MKEYTVEFSYSILVKANSVDEAEIKARKIADDNTPLTDELNIRVDEVIG